METICTIGMTWILLSLILSFFNYRFHEHQCIMEQGFSKRSPNPEEQGWYDASGVLFNIYIGFAVSILVISRLLFAGR